MKILFSFIIAFAALFSSTTFADQLDYSNGIVIQKVGACSVDGKNEVGMSCSNDIKKAPECGRCQRAEPTYCRGKNGWYQCGWTCVFDTYTCGA